MKDIPEIEIEVTFRSKEQGGRQHPLTLADPMKYRPHFVVGNGEYLGVIFLKAPEHVEPGRPFTAVVALVYHPRVDYSALVPGAEFTVREGPGIVGNGRVINRWLPNE